MSLPNIPERFKKKLSELKEREYLWPFSNPPYIINEENVPIAQFTGEQANKTILTLNSVWDMMNSSQPLSNMLDKIVNIFC